MEIRWTGDDARDLAVSGGCITFPHGQWVDVEKAAEASGIPVDHAVIAARSVLHQEGWERKTKTKES